MRLKKSGREFYSLEITTTPPLTGWQASFDGGSTWVAGSAGTVNGTAVVQWLIAGPLAAVDGTTVAATLTDHCKPIVRAASAPEVIVRDAPAILLIPG